MDYLILTVLLVFLVLWMYKIWDAMNSNLKCCRAVKRELEQMDIKWFASFNTLKEKVDVEKAKESRTNIKKKPITKLNIKSKGIK